MAATSLLALIDDIATLLDDIGALTKTAASKTMGVLGDDLALNAEQVTGVRAERELPVVWAVAKGSAVNKLIIVPVALALSFIAPWVVTALLMIGGAYLCFEGFEKVAKKFLHPPSPAEHQARLRAISDPKVDLVEFEKAKIKGAIRTDFVLSAEIVVIALGTVQDAPFFTRAGVVITMAAGITIGVYTLVAGIVKMDDLGLNLVQSQGEASMARAKKNVGHALLWIAPRFLKALSILGTIAMFLVGGGILMHGFPGAHHITHSIEQLVDGLPAMGQVLASVLPTAVNGAAGLLAGALLVVLFEALQRGRSSSDSVQRSRGT